MTDSYPTIGSEKPGFSPFTTGNTAGKYFVGRENELKLFESGLQGLLHGSPSHFFVAGEHRTGKTSFLEKLIEITRKHPLLAVNPTLGEDRPAYAYISTLLYSIAEGLDTIARPEHGTSNLAGDWQKGKNSALFQHPKADEVEIDWVKKDFHTLHKIMLERGIHGAVLCIDEGQRISPKALSALKNSLQQIKGYMIVLSLRIVVSTGRIEEAGRSLLEKKAKEAEGDFGASRFFGEAIEIGPFRDEREVARCIELRLKDNAIAFESSVTEQIARISACIPGDVMELCLKVYNLALLNQQTRVALSLLNEAFRSKFDVEARQAMAVVAELSDSARKALRCLLQLRQPSSAKEITARLFPAQSAETVGYLAAGIKGDLDRICTRTAFCQFIEERYTILKPSERYALELALNAHP